MNIQHSSKTQSHYTPSDIVEAVRRTMGGIDLDPASCDQANKVVKAESYITKDQNGLLQDWGVWGNMRGPSKVFLNPPGEREHGTKGRPNSQLWWPKLCAEYLAGRVEQAIYVGFSLELLQTAQGGTGPMPLDFPFCIPAKRVNFLGEDLQPQGSPTHANVIIYLPPCGPDMKEEYTEDSIYGFRCAFSEIGRVVVPNMSCYWTGPR